MIHFGLFLGLALVMGVQRERAEHPPLSPRGRK